MSSKSSSSQTFQSAQVQNSIPDSDPILPDAELLATIAAHDHPASSSPPQDAESAASASAAGPQSPDIEENEDYSMEDALDEDVSTRPNRFDGPKSTYRTYTRAERRLDETVNKMRAQNLTAHLYNAHAFKQRARASASTSTLTSKPTKGKGRRKAPDSEYILPSHWTAWPMPPDEVPREGEKVTEKRGEEWTFRMEGDPRPSTVLEDCLIAEVGRAARERLEGREWERGVLGVSDSEHSNSVSDEGAESKTEDEGGKKSSKRPVADEVQMRPIPLADEDTIRKMARPEVRRILQNLDDLLQSLHHQRAAYSLASKKSTSNTDDEKLQPNKKRKGVQLPISTKKQKQATSKTAKRTRAPSQSSDDESSHSSGEPSRPESTAASVATNLRSRSSSTRRHDTQNPRDWSSVLGMAALTGWNPAVVARAAKRCADLFGEDMHFRSIDEVAPTPSIQIFTASKPFADDQALEEERVDLAKGPIPTDEEGEPKERYGYDPPEKDELFCPVFPCRNYNTAFRRTGFSSVAQRDAHIRTVHRLFKTPGAVDKERLYGGVHVDGFLEGVRPREGYLWNKGEK